jgi:hypothetical protein
VSPFVFSLRDPFFLHFSFCRFALPSLLYCLVFLLIFFILSTLYAFISRRFNVSALQFPGPSL